jgi:hypothetical protein
MKRLVLSAAILAALAGNATAQMGPRSAPDPVVIAAMEATKDKCTRETPCKYKVDKRPAFTLVTVEHKGGRTELTFDHKKNLVKRVDSE